MVLSSQHTVEYAMPLGGNEVARLNAQQELFTRSNGYNLHPRFSSLLEAPAQIAEIGTGTGIWMQWLDKEVGSGKHTYTGLDISPAAFPAVVPHNFSFHLMDAREPCPPQWKSKFDIVHIRLLIPGMGHGDWAKVTRCAKDSLKPGGALMWTELRLRDAVPALRTTNASTDRGLSKLIGRFVDILGDRLDAGVPTLQAVFNEVGLNDVQVDVVSSDRLAELRGMSSVVLANAATNGIRRQTELQVEGAWTLEELLATRKFADEDIESGTYARVNIHNFIGTKPHTDKA